MGLAPAFVGAIYLEGFFNEVSFGLVLICFETPTSSGYATKKPLLKGEHVCVVLFSTRLEVVLIKQWGNLGVFYELAASTIFQHVP